ncbi:MAG: ATP-binding protein [bacterium]
MIASQDEADEVGNDTSGDNRVRLDPARLAAVRATGLVDSEIEEIFDRLTRLAVRLVGVPAAFISLVDENRDFYKSACGFGEPLATTRELSGPTFCHLAIQSREPLVIPDTAADPRYRDVPTVRSLGVAAYVGIPLVFDEQVIGSFCAIDVAPRAWAPRDIETLRDLAAITLREIGLGAANRQSTLASVKAREFQQIAELARERMADLFRQAPAFIATLRGPDHVFELANDSYMQLIGHRVVIGKSVVEALSDVRDPEFIAFLDDILATGRPFVGREVPTAVQPTPGAALESRFLTFVYQPLIEGDGSRSGIFVHGVDVTEQVLARHAVDALNQQLRDQAAELEAQADQLHATTDQLLASTEELTDRTAVAESALERAERASAALMASETRYRTLTEAVPVQVWTSNPEGKLNFVSAQTAEYFGAAASEILDDGWTVFLHPDDLGGAGMKWAESLSTGRPYQAEFRLRNGVTGEYRWHLARAFPDRDSNGTIVGWIGSNTDVEGERQARAAAEAANRSKSDFLTMMSHELRTPLNAIGGYAELLELGLQGAVTPEQRTSLERIQRSQRHLLGLINGILNFAKIDAGTIHYEVEDVRIDEIIATCESLTTPQARAKQMVLRYAKPSSELRARADREKVQQIVLNLLSNAIKFTDTGGEIAVTCAGDGAQLAITVADTGRGIPPDQLQRVFEPFVQIDARFTRDQSGTGLGLAISRDLARGMGGDLTVDSTMGEGSTFSLRLPAAAAR